MIDGLSASKDANMLETRTEVIAVEDLAKKASNRLLNWLFISGVEILCRYAIQSTTRTCQTSEGAIAVCNIAVGGIEEIYKDIMEKLGR